MSPTAQPLALAELDGYVWYRNRGGHPTDWDVPCLALPPEEGIASPAWKGTVSETRHCTPEEIAEAKRTGGFYTYAPDYLEDLDAMHRVESTIGADPHLRLVFYQHLVDIIDRNPDGSHRFGACIYWETTHATAAQRAEALLRTTNRWNDSL